MNSRINLLRFYKMLSNFLSCIMILSMFSTLTVFAESNYDEGGSIIVSLGDSYSSGEGIEPFYGQDKPLSQKIEDEDWLAHRSKNSWSGMLTLPSVDGIMANNRNINWYFTAVSGAETKHIKNEKQKKEYDRYENLLNKYSGTKELPTQIEIFNKLGTNKADYVTMTIGGNDVGFPSIITSAVLGSTYLNISNLADKINATWDKFYENNGVRDDLQQTYEDIENAAGAQAKIIVAGYPRLLDETGKGAFFSSEEASIINNSVSNFNNAIESLINKCHKNGMNIWFVSVEDAFSGHGAYSSDPFLNEVIFGSKGEDLKQIQVTSAYSIHPNYNGACAYASCVQRKINELEGVGVSTYATKFNLSAFGYDNELYKDYKIIIDGSQNIALWGLINKDYHEEITVNEALPKALNLSKGTYTITITDGVASYLKEIKTRTNSNNTELIFNTMWGYEAQISENNVKGQYDISNVLNDAVEFNGHWYKVINDSTITSWDAANQYCKNVKGYLATITSQAENDFLYNYITNDLGCESAYFGLTDKQTEGVWKWDNGEEVSYTNWHSGEPNGENPNEDYAMFYYKYSDGTWNDGDFGNNTVNSGTVFICEWGEYQAFENEISEPIRTTSSNRDIVLVLDVSGSMSGTPMEETKKASTNFISTILKEDASIGIVTYDNSATMLSDFSINETSLKSVANSIDDGGGTNIESGLQMAESMLSTSNAEKKIIVLMSDGSPNDGKVGEELISYADSIKDKGIYIYTLGFFESMGSSKSSAQILMEEIASDGCHYEVADADNLVFFFGDIADQINGQKYIYVRIACPVDVTVTYDGETLCSVEDNLNTRTNFGSLTFEDNEKEAEDSSDNRIKVLRLKDGTDYDINIEGNGRGRMNYTIGFMDETGEYTDLRKFTNIRISKRTKIDTVATNSSSTILNVDEDGDGKYDLKYKARANGRGEIVDYTYFIYISIGAVVLIAILIVYIRYKKRSKNKKKT